LKNSDGGRHITLPLRKNRSLQRNVKSPLAKTAH
jgi:hypothetical protein